MALDDERQRRPQPRPQLVGARVGDPDTSRALAAIEDAIRRLEARTPLIVGQGSPEGVVVAAVGTLFIRRDGGAGTVLYVKESGDTSNTGWVAK